ncbi:DEAD/DEAH box helicase family protein [Streptomyces sp. LZ34]
MLRSRRIDKVVHSLRNYGDVRALGVRVEFDFASLGDASAVAPTDPRVFFNALSRADHYEFLRDPQGQVLEEWHRRRTERDLVVKLNTGADKTLVGLIICQSSLNDGAGPALYLAPDPYLAEQAAQQAADLGLDVVTDRAERGPQVVLDPGVPYAVAVGVDFDCLARRDEVVGCGVVQTSADHGKSGAVQLSANKLD